MCTLNVSETRSEKVPSSSMALNSMWNDYYGELHENYIGTITEEIGQSSSIPVEKMSEIFSPSFSTDEMAFSRDMFCRTEHWPPLGCHQMDISCYKDRLNLNLGKYFFKYFFLKLIFFLFLYFS